MKCVIIADLHIKNWSDCELEKETNISKKLNDLLSVISDVCEYCKQHNIHDIICAGDVGHLKGVVHTRSFVLFKNIIEKYKDVLHWHVIPGNHDISTYNQEQNSAQLLEGLPSVTVYSKPEVINNVHLVPWMPDITEYIKTNKPKNCNVLISHFGLNEAQVRSGQSIVSSISIKDLKQYDLVVLGHYHLPQTVGHVWYVGSPIQLNRNEADQEKRFLVLDTETLELESIPTSGYMKYYNLTIENEDDVELIVSKANDLKKSGNDVTVRNRIISLQKELEQSIPDVRLIDESEEEFQDRGITSSMEISAQMSKYLELMNIPQKYHTSYTKTFSKYINL